MFLNIYKKIKNNIRKRFVDGLFVSKYDLFTRAKANFDEFKMSRMIFYKIICSCSNNKKCSIIVVDVR